MKLLYPHQFRMLLCLVLIASLGLLFTQSNLRSSDELSRAMFGQEILTGSIASLHREVSEKKVFARTNEDFTPPPPPCNGHATLVDLVDCIESAIPRGTHKGNNEAGFADPTAIQTDWESTVNSIITTAIETSTCPNINLVGTTLNGIFTYEHFNDANGKTYCVLRETANSDGDANNFDNGWGTFIVDPMAERELFIQVPHPLADANTPELGINVFRETNSRAFVMAGAHRYANETCSSVQHDGVANCSNCECNGTATDGSEEQRRYRESDVAHDIHNPFQWATEEVVDYYDAHNMSYRVLQFHGNTSCADDTDGYLTYGVDDTPGVMDEINELRDHLCANNGGCLATGGKTEANPGAWDIILANGSNVPCNLHGSRNVQGRYINGYNINDLSSTPVNNNAPDYSGNFYHIELSSLDNGPYRNACNWIDAVRETWRPVELMFALDMSGSMNAHAVIGDNTSPTRREVLINSVEEFINAWSGISVRVTNDQFGIVLFRTDVEEYEPVVDQIFYPFSSTTATDVETWLSGEPSQGRTSFGGGIQAAMNWMTDGDRNTCGGTAPVVNCDGVNLTESWPAKHIIAFTDGRQNTNPMVYDEDLGPGESWIITDLMSQNHSAGNIDPCNPNSELDFNENDISLHTIATVSATVDDLEGMVTPDPPEGFHAEIASENIPMAFYNNLVTILDDSSPQIVDYRSGNHGGSGQISKEPFCVNSSAERVLLKISWYGNNGLDFSVFKDGVDVTSLGRTLSGSHHKMFVMDVPTQNGTNPILAEGEWVMHIVGPANDYEVAALVEEPSVDYTLSFNSGNKKAGSTITLTAQLSEANQPVSNAIVEAVIKSPRMGVGTLLSTNPMPTLPLDREIENGLTRDEIKYMRLLQDSILRGQMAYKTTKIRLKEGKPGEYVADFSDTKIPGAYIATVSIQKDESGKGCINRQIMKSSTMGFGTIDLTSSNVNLSTISRKGNVKVYQLSISPRDGYGNYLGPGHDKSLSFSLSTGPINADISSNEMGQYTITFKANPANNPKVTLKLKGEALINGVALSNL